MEFIIKIEDTIEFYKIQHFRESKNYIKHSQISIIGKKIQLD